jgi:hypothetical protein
VQEKIFKNGKNDCDHEFCFSVFSLQGKDCVYAGIKGRMAIMEMDPM